VSRALRAQVEMARRRHVRTQNQKGASRLSRLLMEISNVVSPGEANKFVPESTDGAT
jgi:hypothetical protein